MNRQLPTVDCELSTVNCPSEPEMPGCVDQGVSQGGGGNSLAVSIRVAVKQPRNRGENGVSPVGHGSVMEVGRPEYYRGNQQSIDAPGASLYALAQEVLQDSPEKQFLRDGDREVDAKELERELPE